MQHLIPVFYTVYGRYISRFRGIPFYMDCLTPIQRRLLLTMHEIANGAKTVKCAKIIGHCLGYHPHGDQSVYDSLINLYEQGLIEKQGNFGKKGLEDATPSAFRYTEAKIKSNVDKLCFEYIKYVEWDEYEFEKEPLFIPAPIPIGLIGNGVNTGIAFHTTLIPRYKLSDLSKRLKYLLDKKDNIIIYPNFENSGCNINKDDTEAERILTTGSGILKVIPKYNLDKNNKLHIHGRSPAIKNFNSLKNDESINVIDNSGNDLDIIISPVRKTENIKDFYNKVFNDHLIKNITVAINVCDENGKVKQKGVDELLLTCYKYYVEAVKYKLIDDCINEIEKKDTNNIIILIRTVLKENPNIKTVNDIIKNINNRIINSEEYDFENNIWVNIQKTITDDEIKEICRNKSIQDLIEYEIDINKNNIRIKEIKSKINNNTQICFDRIVKLCNTEI